MDGGVRSGVDVFEMLALGARAVMVGCPYLYGLSVAGGEGVGQIVSILKTELENTMLMTGRTIVAALDRGAIWRCA